MAVTEPAGLLVALQEHFTTVSPDRQRVAAFDREGRLYTYFRRGLTYRRSLASEVQVRWRGEDGRRRRRWLSEGEILDVFAETYRLAREVAATAEGPLRRRLEEEVLRWSPEVLRAERERFLQVYRPVAILPPDQYLSVVLQATEGCSWNRCTFCNFYQGRPFRAQTLEGFQAHIAAVKAFLGKAIGMRRGIFLADGNALALSRRRLAAFMEAVREAFPGQPMAGFVDLYSGEHHPLHDWRELAALGLKKIYIGMETGFDPLLRFLNKPGSQDELVEFVGNLKAAGLEVGLIVMVGIGGWEYARPHAEATLAALDRMPLGQGDLVYLSPFVEHPDSVYAQLRRERGLHPLSEEETEEELARLAAAIRARGLKAARYDIREFVY